MDASRFDSLDFDPRGVLGIPQRLDRDRVVTLRERVGDPPLEGFISHVGVHAVLARQAAGLAQLEGSAVTDKTLETLRVIYRGVMWAYGELRPYLCRLRVLADPETPASEWFRPDVFNETAPLFLLVGLGLVGCCDLSPTELNDLTDAFHARPDPSWRPSEPPGFTTTSATAVPLAG